MLEPFDKLLGGGLPRGKVVELGRKLNVPTPTHGVMFAVLKPYIMGTPA